MTETADESAGRFREAWRGYDRREVDAFVTAADLKATRLQRDLTRMETLLSEHRDKERSLHHVLVSAETMADQIREKAQQEAQEILRSARAQAEGILHAARQEVDAFREQSEGLKLRRQETAATLEAFIESLTSALESVRAGNSADHVARIVPPQVALPPPIPARPDHPQSQPERADGVTNAAPETLRFNPSRAMNLPEFVLPAPADWVRAAAMKPTVERRAPAPQPPAFRAAPLRQMAVWLAAGVVFVAILLYLWMGGSRQVAVSASRQVAAVPSRRVRFGRGNRGSGQPATETSFSGPTPSRRVRGIHHRASIQVSVMGGGHR